MEKVSERGAGGAEGEGEERRGRWVDISAWVGEGGG